jgi:hypothetical protein
MANLIPQTSSLHINPFSGSETDDFDQFLRQIDSAVALGDIQAGQHRSFLHLHLRGALRFYDQLVGNQVDNFAHACASLRNRYASPRREELHKITFGNRKFSKSKESVEDFLTDLQRIAELAYPGGPRADKRTRRVRDAFIHGMPNKIQRHLFSVAEAENVVQLCERAAKCILLDNLCPDEHNNHTFNEVAPHETESENDRSRQDTLVAQITEQMSQMSDKMKKMTEMLHNFESHQHGRQDDGPENQEESPYDDESRTPSPPQY